MPWIPQRWDGANQWYFVTVVTQHRELIFVSSERCRELQQAFREVHAYHRFRLGALIILPDHWHGLIRPTEGIVIVQIACAFDVLPASSKNACGS